MFNISTVVYRSRLKMNAAQRHIWDGPRSQYNVAVLISRQVSMALYFNILKGTRYLNPLSSSFYF